MLDNLVKIFDDFTKGDRIQDLGQLAQEEKLSLTKRQSFGEQTTEIKGFKIFSGKGSKRLIGILSLPCKKFIGKIKFYDYLVTKDLETKTTSIIEIYAEEIDTDYFIIEPKGAIGKMKNMFVSSPIVFPELKEFHKSFEIEYDNSQYDYLFKRSALELMNDYPRITCEGMGNYFLFYRRKKIIEVHDILPLVQFAEEFVRLMCYDDTEDYV
jgi:hypothetical protein